MADALTALLAGDPIVLGAAVILDLALGDPVYPLHPVRLMGVSLTALERVLRRMGADGYVGGAVLFLLLAIVWVGGTIALLASLGQATWAAWIVEVLLAYSLLALGDLLRHVRRLERALGASSLEDARRAVAALVGRDTDRLDAAACRRAAIESLSESLTDGFTSAMFWYVLLGLPGLVLFKVVSTMDSMVGYRTPRYLRFGRCGARVDDAMNFVPARLTWLLLSATAAALPRLSGRKAFTIGLTQHAILPGPNSGWSEAATAGAIERRLVGPIWIRGALVTDTWVGDPADPPAGSAGDLARAMLVVTVTALVSASLAVGALAVI